MRLGRREPLIARLRPASKPKVGFYVGVLSRSFLRLQPEFHKCQRDHRPECSVWKTQISIRESMALHYVFTPGWHLTHFEPGGRRDNPTLRPFFCTNIRCQTNAPAQLPSRGTGATYFIEVMAAITTQPTEIQMAASAPAKRPVAAASPTRRMRLG
jgi:hypothetical protein